MKKSIRLNKELREEIINNIAQAYDLKNPCPAHQSKEDLQHIFLKVIEAEYFKQEEAVIAKLASIGLTKELIHVTDHFKVYTDNQQHFANFYFKDAKKNYVSHLKLIQGVFVQLDMLKKYPLIQAAYKAYKKALKTEKPNYEAKRQWTREKEGYLQDVRNVIFGVNTTKQLLEEWAEVEPFIPTGIVDPSRIQLPAVNIAQLTKKIV